MNTAKRAEELNFVWDPLLWNESKPREPMKEIRYINNSISNEIR
jgi:hypothetical protein